MPKAKWGIDADEPEELQTFDAYDGPTPPAGVYHFVLKRLSVRENRNKDDMLNGLVEIRMPKGDERAKYNGWSVWFNQNVTDQGKPYVLQFLKALGLTWNDFMRKTVFESDERPTKIVKIGNMKFNDGNEPAVRATIKMGKASADGQYPASLGIGTWLPPKDGENTWDDSNDGGSSEPDADDPFA